MTMSIDPNYNTFEQPVTLTLTMSELSSITLALSTARTAYNAKGTDTGLLWCFGRARACREHLDKLEAIEHAHYHGADAYRDSVATLRALLDQPY